MGIIFQKPRGCIVGLDSCKYLAITFHSAGVHKQAKICYGLSRNKSLFSDNLDLEFWCISKSIQKPSTDRMAN